MHKIYKYQLAIKEKQELALPVGAQIIRVQDVDGLFFLWAIVNPDETEMEIRYFEAYKTGMPIDKLEGLNYIGFCAVMIMQELGLYIFERTN